MKPRPVIDTLAWRKPPIGEKFAAAGRRETTESMKKSTPAQGTLGRGASRSEALRC